MAADHDFNRAEHTRLCGQVIDEQVKHIHISRWSLTLPIRYYRLT